MCWGESPGRPAGFGWFGGRRFGKVLGLARSAVVGVDWDVPSATAPHHEAPCAHGGLGLDGLAAR